MGLDRPLPVQYALWLGRVVRGDLGVSYLNGLPVTTMLAQRIPVTLQLTVASLVVALAIAAPLRHRLGGAAAVVDRPLGDGLQCPRDGGPDILARHPPGPLLRALAPLAPDVGLRALLAGAGARGALPDPPGLHARRLRLGGARAVHPGGAPRDPLPGLRPDGPRQGARRAARRRRARAPERAPPGGDRRRTPVRRLHGRRRHHRGDLRLPRPRADAAPGHPHPRLHRGAGHDPLRRRGLRRSSTSSPTSPTRCWILGSGTRDLHRRETP